MIGASGEAGGAAGGGVNTGPVPKGLGLARVQDVWPAWGVGVYHASKIVPVAVLWGMLAVSQVRNGVWLPWRSIARSDAAADWRPIVATSGLLALAVTAVVMAISLIAPAAAEADPACQEAPSVCWAVRGYLSAQGADPSQMEELHFDHVSVSGNAAVVSVRFPAADQPSIGIYTVVLDKGVWIVTRP